jgi:PqqD family protein of HPr-rel-A system
MATGGPLEAARFEDGALVFNPVSWDTHLLNPQAMHLLEMLQQSPRSTDTLATALAAAEGAVGDCDDGYRQQVAATLADMEALGLVARDATHAEA